MYSSHKFRVVLFLTAATVGISWNATAQTIDNTFDYWLMPAGLVQNVDGRLQNGQQYGPATKSQWRGVWAGKSVALAAGSAAPYRQYDLFSDEGTTLQYWTLFLGNSYPPEGTDSHAFAAPYTFLNKSMQVGEFILNSNTDQAYSAQFRKNLQTSTGNKRSADHILGRIQFCQSEYRQGNLLAGQGSRLRSLLVSDHRSRGGMGNLRIYRATGSL